MLRNFRYARRMNNTIFNAKLKIFSCTTNSELSQMGRESITAKLVANLITETGADHVFACELHSGQSMGYFDIPVDHVQPVFFCEYFASRSICSNDLVVESPDFSGAA
ncbi:putative ribose-phosphate diphosphokinase [Helianthus annuus]|uniref:Ribose-phosphate diphosphokinase n=1 Tax=Helianthus annuus TaxID=4232 RepID=A0A9K3HZ30_HELAN|nr:putative ribose-phosphate diphosphokinase [Helianthus annuus]KAJ0880121.1 putative ribose-phosphate diphosphokinase [Helianthus annuus]